MKRTPIAIVGGIGLLLIAAFALVCSSGGGTEGRLTNNGGVEREEGPSGEPRRGTGPEPARLGIVSGRVLDETKAVVVGATVCIAQDGSPIIGACHRSDDRGTFEFGDLRSAAYRLSVSAEGFRAGTFPQREALFLGAGATEDITVVLRRGRSIAVVGVVSDVAGGPISEASVSLLESPHTVVSGGVTDDEGRFRLLANPGASEVRAVADGYAFGRVQVTVPSGPVAIALIPESVIGGRVLGSQGEPIPGAEVTIRPEVPDRTPFPGRTQDTSTDKIGGFAFHHLQPGHYTVCATADGAFGCAPGSISVNFGEALDDLEILLHEARLVQGRIVVAGSERGCVEGSVHLLEDDTGAVFSGPTTRDGSVRIPVSVDGRYGVRVECTGYASRSTYDSILVSGEDVNELRWEVDAGVSISGRVVDRDSEPIANAEITLSTRANGDPTATRTSESAEDGSFEVTGLVAGPYGVRAQASGFADAPEAIEVVAPGDVVVVLSKGGTIEGTVRTGAGEPISGMLIVARLTRTTTDTAGYYRIEDAAAGRWTIQLGDRTGWAMVDPETKLGISSDVDVVAGRTVRADFTVPEHEHEITGTVLSGGAEVESAFVYAIPEPVSGALPGRVLRDRGAPEGAVLTDLDGRFRLSRLQGRTYTVKSFVRGGGETQQSGVLAGSEVTLTLEETTSLAGSVQYADGTLPEYYSIEAVHTETSMVRRQTYQHADGHWSIGKISPGNYHVVARSRGGRAAADVTVAASGVSNVHLVIDAAADSQVVLSGRVVRLEDSEPLGGFRVVATSLDAAISSQREFSDRRNITSADGRFMLPNPPLGRATVHVIPANLDDRPKDLGTAHLTIDVSAAGGRNSIGDIPIPTRRRGSEEPRGHWGFEVARWNHDGDQAEQSATVVAVRAGSDAQRQGLVVGDTITSIDGYDIRGNRRYILYYGMNAPVGAVSTFESEQGKHLELQAE